MAGGDCRRECGLLNSDRIFWMAFSKVYPLLVSKAERQGCTKEEVDEIIYRLQAQLDKNVDFEAFFEENRVRQLTDDPLKNRLSRDFG